MRIIKIVNIIMLSHMGNTHENYFNPVNFNDQEVKIKTRAFCPTSFRS